MSSLRDDLEWEEAVQGASHGGPWPAFVDLFAATALILLVFFAVVTFQYLRLETDESVVRSQVNALYAHLDSISRARSGFSVERRGMSVLLTLEEKVSFPQGQSGPQFLKPEARSLLADVDSLIRSPRFQRLINEVEVVGHADSVPGIRRSNWELSAARAATVAEFLVGKGLDPCRVISSGRGEYYPRDRSKLRGLSLQDTLEADRRVEILLLPTLSDTTQLRPGCRRPARQRSP